MTKVNGKTVKLNTGKILHDFTEAQFVMSVKSFSFKKGVGKIVGITPKGVEIELVTFNPKTVEAIKASWGKSINEGAVLQGLLPYRPWTGRYNNEPKHQLYLDARGVKGDKGAYTLTRYTAEPVVEQEADVDATVAAPEQAAPAAPTCKCRKTKTGACHKTDAKKYH